MTTNFGPRERAARINAARSLVLDHLERLDAATPGKETTDACRAAFSSEHLYLGVHPFNTLRGPERLAEVLWSPFHSARSGTPCQRRLDIVIAGHQACDIREPIWVVAMGHCLWHFDRSWLGIPPTGKVSFLRFASAFRVESTEIVETVEFLDILGVLDQAGVNGYSGYQTAAQFLTPGPRTHDGILSGTRDPTEGRRTMDLTKAMLDDLVANGMQSPVAHLKRFWHPDMNWFGPTGIGSCLGFKSYRRGHTGPFEERLEFVQDFDTVCRIAEGDYAAFFWRPCLSMRSTGGFLGLPPLDRPAEMRVVDLYRRQGDRLAENWIFIDMLHFLNMQGVDVLSGIQERET
ncbi:MAG: ester cyclase [Paracoccaceae bacterium]|nr:ester cyclase [Paracoccaceae bacterium]